MKIILLLSFGFLAVTGRLQAQVNLTCVPGGSVSFQFGGANGACVTTGPVNGYLRFNLGTDCSKATNDPLLLQSQCGCCPIFRNDCFKYINTNTSAATDAFTIGGINYTVTIALPAVSLTCAARGSTTTTFSGVVNGCLTTAPSKGYVRYASGADCADATKDPVSMQASCSCCPIANGNCIKYTSTDITATSDVFVIGGITYNVTVTPVPYTTLTCPAGGSISLSYPGSNGVCVTTGPGNGYLRFNLGSDCSRTTNDPLLLQSQCGCCPIFRNDCFKYTNTNASASSDFFNIGASNYQVSISPTALPVTFSSVKAYQQNNNIAVEWKAENETGILKYEVERSVNGVVFNTAGNKNATGNNQSIINYSWLDMNAIPGNNFYRIKSIENNGRMEYSTIVKVYLGKGNKGISVYPNPLAGEAIHLQMNNVLKGSYSVILRNSMGEIILKRAIQHATDNSTETIAIEKNMARGIYLLEITYPDNTKTATTLIY